MDLQEEQEIEIYRNNHKFRRRHSTLGPVQEVEIRLRINRHSKIHPNRSYNRFSLRVRSPLSAEQKEHIDRELKKNGYLFVFFTDARSDSILVLGFVENPQAEQLPA